MTKGEALRLVAGWAAGNVKGGSLEEATGLTEPALDKLSNADLGRLSWAVDEVARRLYAMGTRPRDEEQTDGD